MSKIKFRKRKSSSLDTTLGYAIRRWTLAWTAFSFSHAAGMLDTSLRSFKVSFPGRPLNHLGLNGASRPGITVWDPAYVCAVAHSRDARLVFAEENTVIPMKPEQLLG